MNTIHKYVVPQAVLGDASLKQRSFSMGSLSPTTMKMVKAVSVSKAVSVAWSVLGSVVVSLYARNVGCDTSSMPGCLEHRADDVPH